MFSRGIEEKVQSQIHKLKESQPVVCRNKKTALPFTAPMVCSGVAVVEIDRKWWSINSRWHGLLHSMIKDEEKGSGKSARSRDREKRRIKACLSPHPKLHCYLAASYASLLTTIPTHGTGTLRSARTGVMAACGYGQINHHEGSRGVAVVKHPTR
ncbi:hypothetical protein LXL04_032578 [Taraxacum kok-saghyz]